MDSSSGDPENSLSFRSTLTGPLGTPGSGSQKRTLVFYSPMENVPFSPIRILTGDPEKMCRIASVSAGNDPADPPEWQSEPSEGSDFPLADPLPKGAEK